MSIRAKVFLMSQGILESAIDATRIPDKTMKELKITDLMEEYVELRLEELKHPF